MRKRSSKRSIKERWMSTSSIPSSDFCSNEQELIPPKTHNSSSACTKARSTITSPRKSYSPEPPTLSMHGWQKPRRSTEHSNDLIGSLQALRHSSEKIIIARSPKVSTGTFLIETRVWANLWILIAFLHRKMNEERKRSFASNVEDRDISRAPIATEHFPLSPLLAVQTREKENKPSAPSRRKSSIIQINCSLLSKLWSKIILTKTIQNTRSSSKTLRKRVFLRRRWSFDIHRLNFNLSDSVYCP